MSDSDVSRFVVHRIHDESVRCTRWGAIQLLEAEIVVLEDEAQGYRVCIKGLDLLQAIVASDQPSQPRVLRVRVNSTTDDIERILAALKALNEKNPTGRAPYSLPEEEKDG